MTVYRFNKETGKIESRQDEHPSWVSTFGNPIIRTYPNGKHRRTSPKAHSNPAHGAGGGSGGTNPWATAYQGTFNLSPGAVNYTRRGGKSITQADYVRMLAKLSPIISLFDPKPPTLPYAGIRTGEIIGHRLWWVLRDGLYSLAHNFRWEPGATIEGKLNELVFPGSPISVPIYGGIYAYASCKVYLEEEYAHYQTALKTTPSRQLAMSPSHPVNHAIGLVRGTVKLWGEVIEHEKGWRAQFAKLASIEEWVGDEEVSQILQPYYDSLKERKNHEYP